MIEAVEWKRIILLIGFLIASSSARAIIYNQNLLADSGFESGTVVPSASGGWATIRSVFSQDYSKTGQWSLYSPYGSSFINAPAVQFVNATPGQTYTASVWGLTPVELPPGLQGSLIVFFADNMGRLLGDYNGAPQNVDQNSAADTWIPLSLTITAPTQATSVYVEITLFNFSPNTLTGTPAVYFDDVSLVAVPEPHLFSLLLSGCVGCLFVLRSWQ